MFKSFGEYFPVSCIKTESHLKRLCSVIMKTSPNINLGICVKFRQILV